MMAGYSNEELTSIYELGRLYFEMGYFAPAERIFNGLAAVDEGRSPARIGQALIKLERGLYQEAATYFRAALDSGAFEIQAKLGLCACFVAAGDSARGQSILSELAKIIERNPGTDPELRKLYQAFILRSRS